MLKKATLHTKESWKCKKKRKKKE